MAGNSKYITVSDDNFKSEVLEGAEPVLVDFWASWCGPCHVIAPVIEELALQFEGRAKVGKVDVDQNANLARQYGIRSIPTLVFFKDGRVVDQVVAAVTKRVLADKLHALLQPASGEERISSDSYAPAAKTSSDTKGGRDLASPLRRGASSLARSIRRAVTSAINVGCRLIGAKRIVCGQKRPGKVDWRHSWRAQSEAGSFAGSFAVPWNRAVRPSKKGHRPRRVKNESDVRGALTKTTAPTERDSGVREKGLE